MGRVRDLVLRAAVHRAEHTGLAREAAQDVVVRVLERLAGQPEQLVPGVLVGDHLLRVQPPGGALLGHLEEQQVGQLFGVLVHVDARVAKHVAPRNELRDQAARVGRHCVVSVLLPRTPNLSRSGEA
jgi:hypothetical protein